MAHLNNLRATNGGGKTVLEITGHIDEAGQLKLVNRKLLTQWLADNHNKNVVLTIERKKKKRSNQQCRYWFGVVVPMVQAGINDLGNDYSKEETHEFLKSKFNTKEVEISEGHYIDIPLSTARLGTMEFMELIARVQQFASEMLGIVIPDPETQATMNF